MEISCRKSCGLCTSLASHPCSFSINYASNDSCRNVVFSDPKTTLLTETVTTTTPTSSVSLTATPTTTTGSTPKTTIINLTTSKETFP